MNRFGVVGKETEGKKSLRVGRVGQGAAEFGKVFPDVEQCRKDCRGGH